MKTKIETKVVIEYPEAYPRTPECEKYLQLRAKHEDTQGKRTVEGLLAALSGTSGLNNAADNEEFRKIQYAYHDCHMTAMRFFSASKAMIKEDTTLENKNGLTK